MKWTIDRYEEVPFTSARCLRLLRTVTSRLGVLRKLAKHASHQAESIGRCVSRGAASSFPDPEQSLSQTLEGHVLSPRTKDPDWIPQNRKRQCNRTYTRTSKRRKIKTDEASAPTTQDFHTPFIKRVLVSNLAQSPIASPTTAVFGRDPQANAGERKRRCLPTLPINSADQAYRTLLEAFESILIATKPDSAPSRLGTSSLLQTCLRKIPAHIHLEQSYAENNPDKASGDVTSDVYDYLESFGSRQGGGWKGLRCVIRAHTVSLMQDAMNDGILPGDSLDALLAICSKRGAIEESRSILRSWFESKDDTINAKLNKFIVRCVQLGHRSLLLQGCKDAIQRDIKALKHLCEQPTLWREVVKAFVATSDRVIAASFCETYITSWLYQKQTTEQLDESLDTRAIHNANVLLTAFAWKRHSTQSSNDVARDICRWPVHVRLAGQTVQGVELIQPFLLSSLILRIVGYQPSSDVQSLCAEDILGLIGEQRDPSEVASKVTDFILEVGKYLARVDNTAAHNFMRLAVTGLLQMTTENNGNSFALLKAITTSSTKAWADICDDNESYSLLEEVEYSIWAYQERDIICSPVASQPTSYRWEEGLCEWVAKTPSFRDSGITAASDDNSDSVHDSGVDLGYESPDEKSCRALIVDGAPEVADGNDWDDEDELALITPIQQRQKGGGVRFDLPQQDGCCWKNASNLSISNSVLIFTGDDSDDELAFG